MEIRYERRANQSFMVLEGDDLSLGYEEHMLRENDVSAFLPFYTMTVNRKVQFWYDITGKQSLRDYLEREKLTGENLSYVLTYLSVALDEAEKYLIPPSHISINPDLLYVEEVSGLALKLCYHPAGRLSLEEQLRALWEYLLTIVDHEDEPMTMLCYQLYEESLKRGFTLARAKALVEGAAAPPVGEAAYPQKPPRHDLGNTMPSEEYSRAYIEEDERNVDGYAPDNEEVPAWDEEEGEEEEGGVIGHIFGRLWEKIRKGRESRRQKAKEKQKQLFPGKEDIEDFIVDPSEDFAEPTVAFGGGWQKAGALPGCQGKLQYEGQDGEKDIVLDRDVFRIGSRSRDNDILLSSERVSRHHARISRVGQQYYLEDLNSTNGTYLNGRLLNYKERVPLASMDEVRFADVVYRMI